MKSVSRRGFCAALPAAAVMSGVAGEGQTAEKPVAGATLPEAKVFSYEQMPSRKMANGGESRDVARGVLLTGEAVAVHESELPVGSAAPALHRSGHSEMICVREGTVEFQHDGKAERVGPGGVIFAASNVMHGLKNVGTTAANYFVIAIGRESAMLPAGAGK